MAAIAHLWRADKARRAILGVPSMQTPPACPYMFFGLHMQPESSIDVWAPFFSNQMWVVELLARVVPPTHQLLIKVHKSDTANYSIKQLKSIRALPSVQLVAPNADTFDFIQKADLVFSIQGTIGLEAALIGKPVIMLGNSPYAVFPSVSRLGEIDDLPRLVRKKLTEEPPARDDIVTAYLKYLAPYLRASSNDWAVHKTDAEIDKYVVLLEKLADRVRNVHEEDRSAGEKLFSF
jgi:hypothetical protein